MVRPMNVIQQPRLIVIWKIEVGSLSSQAGGNAVEQWFPLVRWDGWIAVFHGLKDVKQGFYPSEQHDE